MKKVFAHNKILHDLFLKKKKKKILHDFHNNLNINFSMISLIK